MDSYKAIQRVCFFSAFALIGHNSKPDELPRD